MTQEQYVNAMLKLAYLSGFEMAKQGMEKEAIGGTMAPAAGQARMRGENPRLSGALNRMAGPKRGPRMRFKQPGPRMTMGGRTPGRAVQRYQQKNPPASNVASK